MQLWSLAVGHCISPSILRLASVRHQPHVGRLTGTGRGGANSGSAPFAMVTGSDSLQGAKHTHTLTHYLSQWQTYLVSRRSVLHSQRLVQPTRG